MNSLDYDFDPGLFTRVFNELINAKTRFVVNYGGTSSSKSFSMYQLSVIWLLKGIGDVLMIRKYGTDLENSCYDNTRYIAKEWGVDSEFKTAFSGSTRYIRHKETGRRALFRGLDDPEKIKSIFGIKKIIVEEANQLLLEDFMELNRRVRGMDGIQIFLLFNPILETHWINEYFFNGRDNTTIVHSTYKDNKFLTSDDIAEIEELQNIDINQWRVYGLGQWGKPGVKRPFAFAFSDAHIHRSLVFNGKLPIYLSFDFNVDPITCTASQLGAGWWSVIREFRLPESDIYELITEIKASFPRGTYFKVTGDATGSARSAMTKGHTNYYMIIKNELKLTPQNFDVPKANPSIKDTRALLGTLMRDKNFRFKIDESCRYTIDDLRYVEVDEHGMLMKKEAEKEGMGHLLDTVRYTAFRYFGKYLKHNIQYKLSHK